MKNISGFSSIVLIVTSILIVGAFSFFYTVSNAHQKTNDLKESNQDTAVSREYKDDSTSAKSFYYEEIVSISDEMTTYSVPSQLTFIENPKKFFEEADYRGYKSNYIFSEIDTCDFSFYFDEQNPIYFIAVKKGRNITLGNVCNTNSYLSYNEKTNLDKRLEGDSIKLENNSGEEIYGYVRSKPYDVIFETYTFLPEFKSQEEYKFILVYFKPYEKYVKPVYIELLNSFDYKETYSIPTKIEWNKISSSIVPISFEYPKFWGEYKEKIEDVSFLDDYKADSYTGVFSGFDLLVVGRNTVMRESFITGKSNSYAPPRGYVPTDFKGIPNETKGIYIRLGTSIVNCNNTENLRGTSPRYGVYIDFNLPDNNLIQGIRWQLPIISPYMDDSLFETVSQRCYLSESNELSKVRYEVEAQLQELLSFADAETKANILILNRIMDTVEITN